MRRSRLCVAVLPWGVLVAIAGCASSEKTHAPAVLDQAPASAPADPVVWLAPLPHDDCYAGQPISLDASHPVKVLPKEFFTVGYSEERKDPLWVCYRLGPATDLATYKRPSRFKTDLSTDARVSHGDYTNTGYSRGHMAPKFALGSRHGKAGSDSTFIMSNVCPQYQSFNGGQWGDLEEDIAGRRSGESFTPGWADAFEEVWVVVGPIFDEPREPLPAGVQVPNAYYCIVVDEDGDRPRAIAFIMPHVDERKRGLQQFLTSVDTIEARTDIDFFKDLPDDLEDELEAQTQPDLWPVGSGPN